MTRTELIALIQKKTVHVTVMLDGREYMGEVLWKSSCPFPYVSFLTQDGFRRIEFTFDAISRAINEKEALYA